MDGGDQFEIGLIVLGTGLIGCAVPGVAGQKLDWMSK
jgi:hypothetical protein